MTKKIEEYLRKFADQNLANLQAAAEDGKLQYYNRCGCLLFHQSGSYSVSKWMSPHAELAREAEKEFWSLPWTIGEKTIRQTVEQDDEDRNRLMLPLISAEWARRTVEREEIARQEVLCAC